MKVFFDNCTSPVFANTLDGFLREAEHSAHHIRDLPCGRHASDEEWIGMLAQSGETWLVITGDGRIQRNKVLRHVYRKASLRGFVLAPSYQKLPVNETAALLVWRWPEMEAFIGSLAGSALFVLPVNRTSKFTALPL